jgi:hypothetical protein
VTDDSVFNLINQKNIPPDLPTMVYIENEVRRDENWQLPYANEYISEYFVSGSTD